MVRNIFALTLFFIFSGKISGADITCDIYNCVPDSGIEIRNEDFSIVNKKMAYTVNDGENLNIIIPSNSGRNLISVKGNPNSVSINSSVVDSQSFDGVMGVFELINNIDINNSGLNGSNGKNSSDICAENFVSGKYGQDAKDYFLNKRSGSVTPCDLDDVSYLKNNQFSCDIGLDPQISSSRNILTFEEKRMCRANISQNLCVKKTFDVTCEERLKGDQCCNTAPDFNYITDYIIPQGFFSNLECRPSLCDGINNGLVKKVTNRVTSTDLNNPNYCQNILTNRKKLNLTFLTGLTVQNISIATTTRNNVTMPNIVVSKDGNQLTSANYRLIITSLGTLKNNNLDIRNCFGLNGSAQNDYACDIKPGIATVLKLRAVDVYGDYSDEISLNIGEPVHSTYSYYTGYECTVNVYCGCKGSYYTETSNGWYRAKIHVLSNGTSVTYVESTCSAPYRTRNHYNNSYDYTKKYADYGGVF